MSRTLLALLLCGGTALVTGCEKKADKPAPAPVPVAPPVAAPPPAAPVAPAGVGTIKGSVAFTGKAPEMPLLKRDADPFCAATKMKAEDVLVNPNSTLKNVYVRLTNVTGTFEAPKDPAVVTQEACMYRPRVQGIMAGQTLQVKNGDKTLHNVHTYKGTQTMFNQAQIPNAPAIEKRFNDSGAIVKFKCDVHPWMAGFVAVSSHPFFAVTGDDGSFELKNVPAGAYKMEAWHEKGITKTVDVTVAANGVAEAKFSFDAAELK